jgi:hypothetical protein
VWYFTEELSGVAVDLVFSLHKAVTGSSLSQVPLLRTLRPIETKNISEQNNDVIIITNFSSTLDFLPRMFGKLLRIPHSFFIYEDNK